MLSFVWISGLVVCVLYFRNIRKYYKFNSIQASDQKVKELPELTVIIPFRNEASNLEERIHSLVKQDYPETHFRVLFINDHSSDDYLAHFKDLPNHFTLLDLPDNLQGKVSALDFAIAQTNTEWIICSDADCTSDVSWLSSIFEQKIGKEVVAVCGPVSIQSNGSLLEELQFLDMIGVMGMTAAGHRGLGFAMANGANLAFRKSSFEQVGGFEGSEKWFAADDMWLISKFAKLSDKQIKFTDLQASEVSTYPVLNWADFFRQRIRWAGKTASYTDFNILYHIGIAYAFSFYLLLLVVVSCVDLRFFPVALTFFVCRLFIDYSYLLFMTKKYGHNLNKPSYLLVQCLHIFYIVSAGFLALSKKQYKWKDRILD